VRLPPQTPLQARGDRPGTVDCFQPFDGTEALADCQKGKPDGEKVMVLIGDSHAAHWLPAFEALAQEKGWQLWFWAKSSCAYPGVPQWLETYKREYTECQTWRRNVLARVQALPKVDSLLIGRSSPYLSQLSDGSGGLLDRAEASRRWTEGARETLLELSRKADKVAVLQDIPYPGQDVPECLSVNPDAPQECALELDGRPKPDAGLIAAERAAIAGTEVGSVDVTPVVCPDDPCRMITPGGAIVYRDSTHLTQRFAAEAAPRMLKVLRRYFS
jgi:hypothetical protein